MTFTKRIAGAAALAAAMLLGAGLSAPPAPATFIVTLAQVGSNVVAIGSGTIDLAGLSISIPNGPAPPVIVPQVADINLGPTTPVLTNYYGAVTGPMSFGSGSMIGNGATDYSSESGDIVGICGGDCVPVPELHVPLGYVPGSPLSASATWDHQTFASLGVTPGTYVWTWGSGPTADSFTLKIVPEPSSLLLLALPLGLVILLVTRHRWAALDTV